MNNSNFIQLINQRCGDILHPHGFIVNADDGIIYRRPSPMVFQFIVPTLMNSRERYKIFVYPSSPIVDPIIEEQITREMSIPTDVRSQLNEHGVSAATDTFGCRDEAQFNFSFERRVKRLLIEKAVPFLDQFTSVESIVPFLHDDISRVFAFWHLGRKAEAIPLLKTQKDLLNRTDWSKLSRSEFLTLDKLERLITEAGI